MQENPPYSIAEIQLLISQYLDGEMSADRIAEIDALLDRFPPYKTEFLRLQAIRNHVQTALNPEAIPESDPTPLWQKLARQLQSDAQADVLDCDPEFVSAYYDHEISPSDPALQAFEAQLYNNEEANRLLAELGQVSDAIRQFGYRMEEACTLDITQQVMAAYRAEQEVGILLEEIPPNPKAETVSAFADQELSPREIIEANRLIESDENARQMLNQFSQLSEGIQSVSSQIQAQAPDLWPHIKETLTKELADKPNVASLQDARKKRLNSALKLAVPAAAAAILILLSMPSLKTSSLNAARELSKQDAARELSRQEPAPSAKTPLEADESRQLASLPPNTSIATALPSSNPNGADLQVTPVSLRRVPGILSRESEPFPARIPMTPSPSAAMEARSESSLGALASTAPSAMDTEARSTSRSHRGKAPSSEEYLFEALNEQMPNGDLSTLLGQ